MTVPKGRHVRKPWIMRVPPGVREQPAWIFIGLLIAVAGLGYVLGTTTSIITEAIGSRGIRIWGGTLMVSGVLVVLATATARVALEKFALRILATNMFAYAGWVLIVVPLNRVGTTVVLCGALVALAEFRVRHLTALIKRTEILRHELRQRDQL